MGTILQHSFIDIELIILNLLMHYYSRTFKIFTAAAGAKTTDASTYTTSVVAMIVNKGQPFNTLNHIDCDDIGKNLSFFLNSCNIQVVGE